MELVPDIEASRTQVTAQRAAVDQLDPKLLRTLKLGAIIAAVLVLVAGALGVIGWAYDIEVLKHPTDDPALQAAASLNFVLLATSLLLLCSGSPRHWRIVAGRFIAGVVMVASFVTFIEHTCQLFFKDFVLRQPSEGLALTYPGPLLPHESLAFFVLAIGALCFNIVWKRQFSVSQACAALVFVPSFIILGCYLLGQSHLCIYFGCVQLSPICSLIFLLHSAALFVASADSGAARILSLKSTSGVLARRSCAGVAILITLLLPRQWLITVGESAGVIDAPTVNIITAIVAFTALCTFGWLCFRRIESEEIQKHEAIDQKKQTIELMKQDFVARERKNIKMICLTCAGEFSASLTHCPHDQSQLFRVLDNLKPDTVFEQRYLILKELGSGGMSTVYLAEQLLMKKMVAVKVLKTRFSSDTVTIKRFQRESQAASSLSHPNVVAIYDFSVSADGQAYMVMEYLEGQSLSEFTKEKGTIFWGDAIELILKICDGLEHAHSKGVIHRDLKPGNVMLIKTASDSQFTPKIVDFGLAKVCDQPELQLTQTGEVFGSPLYMSPEQWEGKPVDLRSDIYAIGCIMYAILTGNPPFTGANAMETMMMHLNAPPPPVPPDLGVPAWLEQIVRKALAKNQDNRFQTVTELKKAITDAVPIV